MSDYYNYYYDTSTTTGSWTSANIVTNIINDIGVDEHGRYVIYNGIKIYIDPYATKEEPVKKIELSGISKLPEF